MIYYVLCGIIILQDIVHRFERRDLYNRIMSKNITEYKNITENSGETHPRKSAHARSIERWRKKGGDMR